MASEHQEHSETQRDSVVPSADAASPRDHGEPATPNHTIREVGDASSRSSWPAGEFNEHDAERFANSIRPSWGGVAMRRDPTPSTPMATQSSSEAEEPIELPATRFGRRLAIWAGGSVALLVVLIAWIASQYGNVSEHSDATATKGNDTGESAPIAAASQEPTQRDRPQQQSATAESERETRQAAESSQRAETRHTQDTEAEDQDEPGATSETEATSASGADTEGQQSETENTESHEAKADDTEAREPQQASEETDETTAKNDEADARDRARAKAEAAAKRRAARRRRARQQRRQTSRAAQVHIVITTDPANAALTIDGKRVSNPFDAWLPRGGKHRIRASAPGYETSSGVVSFRTSRSMSLTLQKEPSGRAPSSSGQRDRGAGFTRDNPY